MQSCWSREGWERDTGHRLPCFNLGWKAPFSIFLILLNKRILKQQHGENAARNAKIDVLEFLNLQNLLLCSQPSLGQNEGS